MKTFLDLRFYGVELGAPGSRECVILASLYGLGGRARSSRGREWAGRSREILLEGRENIVGGRPLQEGDDRPQVGGRDLSWILDSRIGQPEKILDLSRRRTGVRGLLAG